MVEVYVSYVFSELRRDFGCYKTVIIAITHRPSSGSNNGRQIFTLEQELEICKIFLEGKTTIKKLAEIYNGGKGKTTIRNILLRHNALVAKKDQKTNNINGDING